MLSLDSYAVLLKISDVLLVLLHIHERVDGDINEHPSWGLLHSWTIVRIAYTIINT